jgi:hypothetical protein
MFNGARPPRVSDIAAKAPRSASIARAGSAGRAGRPQRNQRAHRGLADAALAGHEDHPAVEDAHARS